MYERGKKGRDGGEGYFDDSKKVNYVQQDMQVITFSARIFQLFFSIYL